MNNALKQEWLRFLDGYWTKTPPSEEGWYPTLSLSECPGNNIFVYKHPDKGTMYAAFCGQNPVSEAWGGYWWSCPQPEMPDLEDANE